MFESDFANVLYTMVIVTLLWLINRLLKSLAHTHVTPTLLHLEGDPEGRGHHWTAGGILLPTHCSLCQVMTGQGKTISNLVKYIGILH